MTVKINQKILVSGVDYFDDGQAINPFMDSTVGIDKTIATKEHQAAIDGYRSAGIEVAQVQPPAGCQDGVYTANWAFTLNDTSVIARLPNARKGEEAYAEQVLSASGKQIMHVPEDWLFSGQGDFLYIPGTRIIIAGYGYRSDRRTHDFIAKNFDCEVISLHSIPQRSFLGYKNLHIGKPVTNIISGIADSPAYDIDLAVGILRGASEGQKPLIAYCPWMLDHTSREIIARRTDIDKIIVSRKEALQAYACNLVSTGDMVIINAGAKQLIKDIEGRGLKTIPLTNQEISKGGGGYRCMCLTLDNSLPA